MKSISSIAVLLVIFFLPTCLSSDATNAGQDVLESELREHPLDLILGDKVLDPISGEVRSNNFHELIGMHEREIAQGSSLYDPWQLNDSLYVLDQVKSYKEARAFSLLLKFNDSLVTDYFLLNDHRVVSYSISENGVVLLCDDALNKNLYWKAIDNILVVSLDPAFGLKWTYTPKHGIFPIMGRALRQEHEIVLQAKVITGCTICYSVVELTLDTNGICQRARHVDLHNSSEPIGQDPLNDIFLGLHHTHRLAFPPKGGQPGAS